MFLKHSQHRPYIEFIERKTLESEKIILEKAKPLLFDAVKNAVMNLYTINGRLINGIEEIKINKIDFRRFDVVHFSDDQMFQGVCTVDFESEISVTLLSSGLSFFGAGMNNVLFLTEETPIVTLNKKLTTDLFIEGVSNLSSKLISFNKFEWIPFEIDNN